MLAETLELWPAGTMMLPKRTRLFNIAPIGVGTPAQEALSSYMVRLARTHSVTPLDLCNRELLPITEIKMGKAMSNFVMKDAKTMNGLNKYALEAVRGFQELTGRSDLGYCTLLPWRDVLERKAISLLHPHPRWCPACFIEWRAKSQDPYWPLLWFLSPAAQCPTHAKALEERCPHCNKHQPFIPRHSHMDYCSHCGHSLAFLTQRVNPRIEFPPKSLSRLGSLAISEMISVAPEAQEFATHERLVARLHELIVKIGDGNAAKMHRCLGMREKATENWYRDGERPTISSLLVVCQRLELSPVQFLRDRLPEPLEIRGTFPIPKLNHRRNLPRREKERIKQALKEVLNGDKESPSMKEVAEQLGHPVTFLRYWWRQECLAIAEKHRVFVKERSLLRLRVYRQRTAEIAREIFQVQPNATTKLVQARLAEERICLAWPEVRAVIREVRQEFRTLPPCNVKLAEP